MIDLIALSAAKKHADLLAMGLTSVSVDNTNKSITFTLAADGSQRTIYFDQPSDGISIVGIEIKNGHLICLMSDGSEIDAGILPSGGSGGSVPKPLTYDYMPEGYPTKSMQTTMLMEEQQVAFILGEEAGLYMAPITNAFELVVGQTYTVNWDGTEYECVCSVFNQIPVLGNLSIMGMGDDTGEPFVYGYDARRAAGTFITLDTSASHTISVKTVTEVISPMAYDYMPEGYPTKSGWSIEWDGNTEGLVAVLEMFYKVSDLLPTNDELIGSTVELSNGKKFEITSDMLGATSEGITLLECIAVVKKDNAIFEDTTFPQKGTYFVKQQGMKAAQAKPVYVQKLTGTITPMAEEFMPPRIVKAIDHIDTVANNAQSTANNAQSTANNAQSTANNAQSTANTAKSTAETAKSNANTAITTANAAKTAANNAQTTANNAKTAADNAKTAADNAQTVANNAQSTAETAKSKVEKALTIESSGAIHAPIASMNKGTYQELYLSSKDSNVQSSFGVTGSTGLQITVCRDGGFNAPVSNPSTVEFINSGGRYMCLKGIDELILNSSAEGSTKKFKITVDDNSSLKAVNASDSSEVTMAKTSDIPTDDHINELINTALSKIGIAEEGAY